MRPILDSGSAERARAESGGGGPVGDAEGPQKSGDMDLHGPLAEGEDAGDLLVRAPIDDLFEHVPLAPGQGGQGYIAGSLPPRAEWAGMGRSARNGGT